LFARGSDPRQERSEVLGRQPLQAVRTGKHEPMLFGAPAHEVVRLVSRIKFGGALGSPGSPSGG
jgi:hypothetical protein